MASLATQIRLQKVAERQRKNTYKHLKIEEKKIVKLQERLWQIEKDMNSFWSTAPRSSNGSVDWTKLDEKQLDYFDYIYKEQQRLSKSFSKFSEKQILKAMNTYYETNRNGTSFC